MKQPLRVLLVEDSEPDARLLLSELERTYQVHHTRVQTAAEFARALDQSSSHELAWDVIIAEVMLPSFSGLDALALARAGGLDLPLLVISGRDDEETERAAMRAGAHDYFVKGRLSRLLPAVERELREAEARRARRAAEARFRGLVEAAPDALVIANAAGQIVLVNSQAEKLFGYSREVLVGQSIERLIPERFRERHRQQLQRYVQAPLVRHLGAGLDLYALHRDGHEIPVEISLSPLAAPEGLLISSAVRDVSERKRVEADLQAAKRLADDTARAAQKTASRVTRLQTITAALVQARLTPAEMARTIVEHAVPALEAEAGVVALLSADGEAFELVAAHGYTPEQLDNWLRFPAHANLPVAEAVRLGQPVLVQSRAEFRRRYPEYTPIHRTHNAWAAVPLLVDDQPVGGLGLSFAHPQAFALADHEFLMTVARQCAVSLERSQLHAAQARQRDELEARVQARTAELRATNQALTNEVVERRLAQRRLESAREEERERISREIHDELGSILTVLKMDLAQLRHKFGADDPDLVSRADDMSSLIDAGVEAARRLASELHPVVLTDMGLMPALEWQFQQFLDTTGLEGTFVREVDDLPLVDEAATAFFRIFQEALTNIARHAEATAVDVRLEQRANFVQFCVSDNGCGLPAEGSKPGHLGLKNMRERAQLVGADLDLSSEPGRGTTVRLVLPKPRAS